MRSCTLAVVTFRATPLEENIAYGLQKSQEASDWMASLDKRPKQKKMDMRFGIWNVRSMYRAGSLRQWQKKYQNMLGLVEVHEVIWDRGVTDPADEYTFCYGKGNNDHELGTGFFLI
jgi:hypothetical protein